jgi:hypothetical protein
VGEEGASAFSQPLDKTVHHPLLAGLVELDGELVALRQRDVAVAEFQERSLDGAQRNPGLRPGLRQRSMPRRLLRASSAEQSGQRNAPATLKNS